MKISWDLHLPWTDADFLALVADACQVAEGVSLPCAVHLTLTDDEEIHKLNWEFRGVDRATDVLSFPSVSYRPGQTAQSAEKRLRREYDDELNACMLGDIVISLEHAAAQAAEYGHSEKRELAYLFAHGLFHLFGYDHMQENEKREMRAMEEKALEPLGLGRESQAVAPSDKQLLELAKQAMQRSYSPYSHFKVGACLLCEDGRVFQGCNVENASFGLTNCAERTAVFKAISEGERSFTAIAIASEKSAPWPCGACRQVLNEFAPNIRVLVTWGENQVDEAPLSALLPHGFGPQDLAQ